jgi:hypothetical protein
MTISAKIVAHSRHYMYGNEDLHVPDLVTYLLRYPRFIHAELMTHRKFSRNASSSRAIPVQRIIDDILNDPAMPIHWGKNQKGMQAAVESDAPVVIKAYFDMDGVPDKADVEFSAKEAWLYGRDRAVEVARAFDAAGYHKQVVNRILEPYSHITVVVTASNYDNFFWLRRHADAQPEIKALADAMYVALQASTPTLLQPGQYHLPFVTEDDFKLGLLPADLLKLSGARAARTSYLTHDGRKPNVEEDLGLYDRLVGSEPLHASPVEHQATPDWAAFTGLNTMRYENEHLSGNFDPGWIQVRKTLAGEFCEKYEAPV